MTAKNQAHAHYNSCINRVIDYIETHIDEPMDLATLASVAHFSPYHFHRLFAGLMGETLNQFIQRVRLEKAAAMLINQPNESITQVAFACGFSSSSTFARAFKETFGKSASQWRENPSDSKICKTDHNIDQHVDKYCKTFHHSLPYFDPVTKQQIWRIQMKDKTVNVRVETLPRMDVVYVRHVGPYKGDVQLFENLFNKLFTWAGARGLLQSPDLKVLTVYHDSPEITAEAKLRISVCITAPPDTAVDGEVGKMTLPGGKYALARFELGGDEFEHAWNTVFGTWLPQSGYQPDERPAFEWCHNNPQDHPEGKHIIDICVPVKPL